MPGRSNRCPASTRVVPARNEEAHIEATVRALRGQDYPNLTIAVVDDQSTDATGAILQELADEMTERVPLRFIRGVERPEGWVGKTWAVHQGVADSTAEWLWFVDADMGLHPSALTTAMAEAGRTGSDLVSLLPGVHCRTFWQGAIASSFLQLLGQLYPLDRVNDPARPDAIASGGFVLVRRSTYDQAGGHAAVAGEIIEDIALARRVKANGGKLVVRLAPELAWTHMYGSFGDIWRGLRKKRLRRDGLPTPQVCDRCRGRPAAGVGSLGRPGARDRGRVSRDDRHRGLGSVSPGGSDLADAGLPRPARSVCPGGNGRDHGVCRDRLGERLASSPRSDLVERAVDFFDDRLPRMGAGNRLAKSVPKNDPRKWGRLSRNRRLLTNGQAAHVRVATCPDGLGA